MTRILFPANFDNAKTGVVPWLVLSLANDIIRQPRYDHKISFENDPMSDMEESSHNT